MIVERHKTIDSFRRKTTRQGSPQFAHSFLTYLIIFHNKLFFLIALGRKVRDSSELDGIFHFNQHSSVTDHSRDDLDDDSPKKIQLLIQTAKNCSHAPSAFREMMLLPSEEKLRKFFLPHEKTQSWLGSVLSPQFGSFRNFGYFFRGRICSRSRMHCEAKIFLNFKYVDPSAEEKSFSRENARNLFQHSRLTIL